MDDLARAGLEALLRSKAREGRVDQVGKWANALLRAREYADLIDAPKRRKAGTKPALKAVSSIENHARGLLKEIQRLRHETFWALVEEMEGGEIEILGGETEAEKLLDGLEGDLPKLLRAMPGSRRRIESHPTRADGPKKAGAAYVADKAHTAYLLLSGKEPRRGSDVGGGAEGSEFIEFLDKVYKLLGVQATATSQARRAMVRHREMMSNYHRSLNIQLPD